MRIRKSVVSTAVLALLACQPFAESVRAEAVDFSCMSYKVWGKSHVSDQYQSFDIVIQNRCPGAVYWGMCIERLGHDTHQVTETHNPTGYVEEGKKARVNLNLKKAPDSRFRSRFQEFYVDIGYSIDNRPVPECRAASCERRKTALRTEIRANESAWERAEAALAANIQEECPETGWDTDGTNECRLRLRTERGATLAEFELKDQRLREQMAALDPELCRVYSGELVAD